ncbi:tetratricopeptide repeat protein [Bacteroides stercorirosoris]|uniref:tetratricopeptide repeat protein n=1 Tax=Bacteroides stercorirosoris TaxID=871324 RepID=UPI00351FFF29
MRKRVFHIWLTMLLSLASCTQYHSPNVLLMQADSLMEAYPDSALRILENVEPQQLKTPANQAYYALLLTQARDKNYIVQTDDSLIRIAVQYYDSIGEVAMQAKAHYYKGCIYRDANLCGEAVQEYLTAIPLAKKTENQKLLGLIYNHAGYLYYLQNLVEQADSIYQLAEKLAIQRNDTSLWAEALTYQGKINIEKGMPYYPKAEEKLLEAFAMTSTLRYKRVQANIASSLSSLYSRMEQKEKAIQYAKLNISLREDTTQCYTAFLLLGDAYFKIGKYDSATIYINKSLLTTRYGTKASAYMRLAEIAQIQGDLEKSLTLTNKYTLYLDSLHAAQQSNDILNAEKKVAEQQYTNTLSYDRHKQLILITASAILIFIIIIGCIILNKHRKKAHGLEQRQSHLKQEQQELQERYLQVRNELRKKDTVIAALQQGISLLQADEEKKQQLQQELNAFQQERNALAKEVFEHSKVSAKMERIINSYKTCDKSDEQLSEEDWKCLIAETDMRWNKVITRLSAQYKLSKTEIHLCSLFLTDFPIANLAYIIQLTRNTIYRKEREIKKKIGCPSDISKLKDFLENY